MKTWKKTLFTIKKKFFLLQQRGQALVEFILLLVAIAGISFGFVQIMNKNLSKYWEYYANLIINDQPSGGPQKVKIQ